MVRPSPLGLAILALLAQRAMERDELARRAKLKKETLDDAISGKRKTRPHTRRQIAAGLGITAEDLYQAEQAHLRNGSSRDLSLVNDSLLREILARVEGLPLSVARSIVTDFGEQSTDKTAGEIETLLRRKAIEYKSLREELTRSRANDPEVNRLRDEALQAVDRGDFEFAYAQLLAARQIDQIATRDAEARLRGRRGSEAETILSTARLAALRANYQDAFNLCLEAHEALAGTSTEEEARIVMLAANYLSAECHDIGPDGVIERNIRTAEQVVLPLAAKCSPSVYHSVLYEIADLYALLGYRLGSNKVLHQAALRFHALCRNLTPDAPGVLRMRSFKSLGDTHVELGLNRKSKLQIRIGLQIVNAVLQDPGIDVPVVERANCLIRLGTAQSNAALASSDEGDFGDAIASYEGAMKLIENLDEPLSKAKAWWGLAIALTGQGKKMRSIDLLKRGEACCNEALKTLTRDKYPIDWATNIANRGNARLERGMIENKTDVLFAAVGDFNLALDVRTRQRMRLGFAKTTGNMAIAKRILAERTNDRSLALSAREHMLESLSALDEDVGEFWRSFYSCELEKIEATLQTLT